MKVAIAILALIAFACASDDASAFRSFIHKYKRVYKDSDEFQLRFQNFQATLKRIDELNNRPGQTAVYAINEFADLSVEEFKASYLMEPFDGTDICIWPYHQRAGVNAGFNSAAAPKSWDWRTKGAVTPVKNQGQCGSCWSFSTTGNLEGQWFLWSTQKKLTGLSEQWLVDCSDGCLVSEPQLCNGGCNGGLPWLAYEDIHNAGGIASEAAYPYTAEQGTCESAQHPVVAKVFNWTAVSNVPSDIEAYLVTQGPLSITINANMLMSYSSGIITGTATECPVSQMDHAVLLVGYDNTGSTPYWIVKNSWATSWGDQGYFKIASAQGLCGINACVTTSLVK